MRECLTIHDRAAAAVFGAATQARIVQTLIPAELSLSALSRVTQLQLSLLHYHIERFVKLGLVEVIRVERRAGRPVKHYRATARSFFVSSELLAKLPGVEMAGRLRHALDRNQVRTVEGINFTHDGDRPCVYLVKSPDSQANALELWLDIGLTNDDAAAFIADMRALADRYRPQGRDDMPRYLVHMAAVRASL